MSKFGSPLLFIVRVEVFTPSLPAHPSLTTAGGPRVHFGSHLTCSSLVSLPFERKVNPMSDNASKVRGGRTHQPKGGQATATPSKNGHASEPGKNKPVHEIRMGRICGAIWPQQGNDNQLWYNVTLSRIYRDNSGNWQRSDSFGRTDLPLVCKVADQCHSWIYQQAHTNDDHE